MNSDLLIFRCSACGNIAVVIEDSGVPVNCCGMDMDQLEANSVDAAAEKHIPVVSHDENTVDVSVGSIEHPMTPEHHIAWAALKTEQGFQIKYLDKAGEPSVKFSFTGGEKIKSVLGYCNLHGLWKVDA